MGALKLGSSSLRPRYSRPSLERLDQAGPISARPTRTRWLGAFSPLARWSGTMRTFLAWTERVTISPVNSFEPVFLKVPMVAILVLLDFCSRARAIAASMAIKGPETIDGAPARGAQQSGGWQSADFVASRGMAAP